VDEVALLEENLRDLQEAFWQEKKKMHLELIVKVMMLQLQHFILSTQAVRIAQQQMPFTVLIHR